MANFEKLKQFIEGNSYFKCIEDSTDGLRVSLLVVLNFPTFNLSRTYHNPLLSVLVR